MDQQRLQEPQEELRREYTETQQVSVDFNELLGPRGFVFRFASQVPWFDGRPDCALHVKFNGDAAVAPAGGGGVPPRGATDWVTIALVEFKGRMRPALGAGTAAARKRLGAGAAVAPRTTSAAAAAVDTFPTRELTGRDPRDQGLAYCAMGWGQYSPDVVTLMLDGAGLALTTCGGPARVTELAGTVAAFNRGDLLMADALARELTAGTLWNGTVAEEARKSFGLALKVRQALDESGAQVVLLGRVGHRHDQPARGEARARSGAAVRHDGARDRLRLLARLGRSGQRRRGRAGREEERGAGKTHPHRALAHHRR